MIDKHPGDEVLGRVLRRLDALYSVPKGNAESRLRTFVKRITSPKEESVKARRARLMRAFSGPKWAFVKHGIASDFADANIKAVEAMNAVLADAFTDGLNEAAYGMSLSGVEMWPITVPVTLMLVAAGVVTLNKRKIKRRVDIAYNADRTQAAINSAIMQDIAIEDIPAHVARMITNARKNEMIAAARASIYGASDSGAYAAGVEAEHEGLDIEKTWLSIMDNRVRPSHAHLHGTTLPIDELFHGYYGDLMYPHDPSAPPAEIYHCRCRMVVHLAGKTPKVVSGFLFTSQVTEYKKWREQQIRKAGSDVELARIHKRRLG